MTDAVLLAITVIQNCIARDEGLISPPPLRPQLLQRLRQMKKAVKKLIHEQWNARMCGRLKLHNLISVALSSWLGSTFSA